MARRGYEDDETEEEEEQYDLDDKLDEEYDDEAPSWRKSAGKGGKGTSSAAAGGKKRARSDFIDDTGIEDDDEEEDYRGGGGSGRDGEKKKSRRRLRFSKFIDIEAAVDSDEEEEEGDEGEEGFIVETGVDFREEGGNKRERRPLIGEEHEEEDVDEIERHVKERYSRFSHMEYAEDATDIKQQALLPSIKDPKLWMVKCAIGREREVAICLMQKYINRGDLHIRSVIALDHLKNYIYVEAEKEAHVKEACSGLTNIYSSAKIMLVPIKEMTDVLSVESKAVDLARDTWVRMKIGVYKGDLAKVVDVDNVRQRVNVKLIPRLDLQMIVSKQENREVPKKKAFVPPPRLFNVQEAREMRLRVERRRDRDSGEYYEMLDGLMFKDGFLHKTVSMKSIYTHNIQPSFDELEKFHEENGGHNRKKSSFMKGDAVIVTSCGLRNIEGWVEKVEQDIVHIKPKDRSLGETLPFYEKELRKHFKRGDHVKVVSGMKKDTTGMIVEVYGRVLQLLSDTTKEEHIKVFADDVVECSEITTGITRIGDYKLHDLVLLDNMSFGVIVRLESEAFQVLKGVPDRPEVVLVRLREIKSRIVRQTNAKDRFNNVVSSKDIVRVIEGPLKGKQGPVEHIYKGILFIHEHPGFICVKAMSCQLVGGSNNSRRSNDFQAPARLPPRGPPSRFGGGAGVGGGRFEGGGRAHKNELVGKSVKIKAGPLKGYRGTVTLVKDGTVRVQLDSLMKDVTVNKDQIADTAAPFREPSRYSRGGENPMHPSRTPIRPIQTPMCDPSSTPIHDGMRTPMHSRAWHPLSPPSYSTVKW